MKTFQQSIYNNDSMNFDFGFEPDVILLFISPGYEDPKDFVKSLERKFPGCCITGCSTSGEIHDVEVEDDSIVLNAIKFDKTEARLAKVAITSVPDSKSAGAKLIEKLRGNDLAHVLIFSDGLQINGADLVEGFSVATPSEVSVTGGLAGDGVDFESTFVINGGEILKGCIVGLGLYGKDLKVGYGSAGGWDSFGIERKVTRAEKNILFELDGKPALELYKSFLGDKAQELPGSGLLFPLSLRMNATDKPVVRTILAVSEQDQSLTFAGNIPEGSYVRLMKANIDRLINGAEDSAVSCQANTETEAEFVLLISCVGRRLVLKQLVEEEVEVVRQVMGDKPVMSGFYSYGELAPFGKSEPCRLHNQTMTITTFSE